MCNFCLQTIFFWTANERSSSLMVFLSPFQLKQAEIPVIQKKKVLSGIPLSFPSSHREKNAIICPLRFLLYSLTKSRWFSQVQTSYLVKYL